MVAGHFCPLKVEVNLTHLGESLSPVFPLSFFPYREAIGLRIQVRDLEYLNHWHRDNVLHLFSIYDTIFLRIREFDLDRPFVMSLW